ncbi:MAG: hypothetical protein DCC75_10140, partial [Proteobacteria bacterium]
MKKSCRLTGQEFEVAQEDLEFYQRLGVPSPTLHPLERQRQRIAFRNFRSLYRRSCDGTKKQIVSMYDSDAPFPVYDTPHWWSDSWDPYSYGQEVHLERSFLDQYLELAKRVPRFSIMNVNCENCSYSNFALESRNCYLVFGCVRNEDCQYGHIVWDCKDCIDNLYAYRCEWCSNGIDIVGCYNVHFSSETVNCRDSYFLHDCRNCSDCFGCFNLRGKEYCFFNEQLTKEEYKKRIESFLPLSHATIQNCLEWLREEAIAKAVYPPYFGEKCEDVSGNHIYEGKNLEYCFDAKRSEYSKYAFTAFG